jgi:hypothetical protein
MSGTDVGRGRVRLGLVVPIRESRNRGLPSQVTVLNIWITPVYVNPPSAKAALRAEDTVPGWEDLVSDSLTLSRASL